MALTVAGYEVEEAADGIDGLRRIDENPPDLVVLDILLADRSGLVLRQEIAAHAHTRRIPIVIVTSGRLGSDLTSADCVLRKPVTPEQLVATVETCLRTGAKSQV
jgi:DNA-binding response OmpR family regulator